MRGNWLKSEKPVREKSPIGSPPAGRQMSPLSKQKPARH